MKSYRCHIQVIEFRKDKTYFPGRAAGIYLRQPKKAIESDPQVPLIDAEAQQPAPQTVQTEAADPKSALDTIKSVLTSVLPSTDATNDDVQIGSIGVLHPDVLAKFDLHYPCSAMELNIEGLM